MTLRQSRTLTFITNYIAERGYSPSYDEMRVHLGLVSKSGIHRLVQSLAKRGLIKITPGCARSVELVRSAAE